MQDLIGRNLGHYGIVEKIGEGGMGVVYRAHDERLDRDVAIKVLHQDAARNPDRLARFEREAKAVAMLNHPNILAIHDFGSDEGVTYAVMELLEGESLREMIKGGGLPPGKAVEYARAIADGLAAAHDKAIIHRDLKPENIFLTKDGRIKILDFGLAKLVLPEQDLATGTPTATLETTPGALLGTVAYMAPEQILGQPLDHRSDIFALGVVLYEMLAGHRPFGGSTMVEIAAAILREDPSPISEVSPGVQPALTTVVSKCLEKRPEDRFSSAHDLSLTLAAVEPTATAPPAQARSLISKRWPHILAVVVAFVIALLFILPPSALIERRTGRAESAPIRSIAVLPLNNLSGDPEQEFFADGMTEALISKLAQIGSLDVISRTSAMLYKKSEKPLPQIARELGVDAVIEGSVMRGENDVRITIQLIHGATDRHLWAEDYHRPLRDVLFLQSEVAQAVVHEIDATLTADESGRLVRARAIDPEAHEAFLKGTHYFLMFTGDSFAKATTYFEHSIEIDPGYSDAYALLAAVQLNSTYFLGLPPGQVVPRARKNLRKALDLDASNANAILVKGWIEMTYDWGWETARGSLLLATELAPSQSNTHEIYAYLLACRGDFEEALVEARRAERLDPLSPMAGQQVGMILYLAQRYEEAIAQLEKTIDLSPGYWFAYQRLAQVLAATGEYERGIEVMRKEIELAGEGTARSGEHTLASLLTRSGNRAGAVKILRKIEEREKITYVPPTDIAQIHAALGNIDEAYRWLEKALEVRDGDLFMAKVSPVWDALRDDPRFDELLRRLNLAED